ncbi:voltage-dependent calcium channel subunit alpha-2/delta-3-like [Lytechinus pictus]|uniref:voltage-dependent calcium channel subunit alpha-2/delta-3-like n=1 Tax=Lytechinus pictus TaxID=7653 RepID=UPI0030BA1261
MMASSCIILVVASSLVLFARPSDGEMTYGESQMYSYSKDAEDGTLDAHVQNWATLVQNYILHLTSEGLQSHHTQHFFDTANYTLQEKNGNETVKRVKDLLGEYFVRKERTARKIVQKVVDLYDSFMNSTNENFNFTKLSQLNYSMYRDADISDSLPEDIAFNSYFKQPVSYSSSIVKISDSVNRADKGVIKSTYFTSGLEEIFKENHEEDNLLRWQYFGSVEGLVRLYPGREWDTNFVGFYNDYDPRVRPWYIAATSGPKDVVIVLDCSYSMKGEKFKIATEVVKTVLDTLTKQDYVNIICARASHWDGEGKWYYYRTEVQSCKNDTLVPATTAHRKDLYSKTINLVPGGTSELKHGFQKAFQLLGSRSRTGCQALIILVTDGKDTDGEHVRCGPGYYTRSGFVPGPICKYQWEKVWDEVAMDNNKANPRARIFSYLTKDDGEEFPGKLACDHRGNMRKLENGEDLISQMEDYFKFLSNNSLNTDGLWTAPYLDSWGLGLMVTIAIPAISQVTGSVIGVVGIDATLDEIENLIVNEQWGSVYAFLIDNEGQTIFHPLLKPSKALVDDPIFINIAKLEQPEGKPESFSIIEKEMRRGMSGFLYIPDAIRGIPKGDFADGVKTLQQPATYYYTSLNQSVYSFAFNLADTDKSFRRLEEPPDRERYNKSYFNLLIEYNSTLARKELPGAFEEIEVYYDEPKYPHLRVSYKYSSIRFAPKCYCNPNAFLFDDDLATKTVRAHKFYNGNDTDVGCSHPDGVFEQNTRADVLITSQIEPIWRNRTSPLLRDVKWTYIGCRSGVFRTYPGHRSRRPYDPTKRPWFHKVIVNPDKTTISTAYMDAAGVGKIISLSQAVFEGMENKTRESCEKLTGKLPGGCECQTNKDCFSGKCYKSEAIGYTKNTRCASERVEAVTSLDILYNDFHKNVYSIMHDNDMPFSCGDYYRCPNGEPGCQTRCYLFDNFAMLITDPIFLNISDLDTGKYNRVPLGKKEGEIMHDLIYRHSFFQRKEQIDFQGSCSVSPGAPRVSLDGIPKTPEDLDDFYRYRGPIPSFSNSGGCIQDVVGYQANSSALGSTGLLTGNISGPCKSGFYYLTALPKTNLFLLVVQNWKDSKESLFFNFNCRITNKVSATGAFRIINGTCDHTDDKISLVMQNKCPIIRNVNIPCKYNSAPPDRIHTASGLVLLLASLQIFLCFLQTAVG